MIMQQLVRRQSGEGRRAAFTLLEVLVVVAILVVLASVASIYVFRYLEDSKKDKAKMDIMALDKAVKTYQIKNDNYLPESLQQVIQFIENQDQSKLIDPWGKPYQYQADNSIGIAYISTTAPDGTPIDNDKAKRIQ